jgi:hypothetical protein
VSATGRTKTLGKDSSNAKVRGWARGFETTPTFDVRGKIIVEFKREELEKALGIA